MKPDITGDQETSPRKAYHSVVWAVVLDQILVEILTCSSNIRHGRLLPPCVVGTAWIAEIQTGGWFGGEGAIDEMECMLRLQVGCDSRYRFKVNLLILSYGRIMLTQLVLEDGGGGPCAVDA